MVASVTLPASYVRYISTPLVSTNVVMSELSSRYCYEFPENNQVILFSLLTDVISHQKPQLVEIPDHW